jgi:uncharacterized membrane protein
MSATEADTAETPKKPAVAPAPVVLQRLNFSDPLHWVELGWNDFRQCPGIGLFYGGCFMLIGWLLLRVYDAAPAYMLALCAGFMLMGPVLCLGLYRVSQQLERGETPGFGDSLLAWSTLTGTLALFGFALLVLLLLWGRATMIIFADRADGLANLNDALRSLFDPAQIENTGLWLGVGGLFAALVFGISVVSLPLVLDRQVDALTAALTSLRLVLKQPLVMLLWGALITGLAVLAMLPAFVGLLVAAPVLGHASWHAYRAAVAR